MIVNFLLRIMMFMEGHILARLLEMLLCRQEKTLPEAGF